MTKKVMYYFYLRDKDSEVVEYNWNETNKDQMNFDIVHNVFPVEPFCIREKYVDWVMEYSNIFLLEVRRKDPDYISKAKSLELMRNIEYSLKKQ